MFGLTIKAILFDLDGTLIDSIPLHKKSFQLLFKQFGQDLPLASVSKYIRWSTHEIYQKLHVKKRLGLDLQPFLKLRRQTYYSLIEKKKLVFENRVKFIQKLRKKYSLALITNSSRFTTWRSTSRALRQTFDVIVTFSDVSHGKPHPEMLLLATKRLKVKPQECVMVGDSVVDVKAAKTAKMLVLAFYHQTGASTLKELRKARPTKIIRHLKELNAFLKKCGKR